MEYTRYNRVRAQQQGHRTTMKTTESIEIEQNTTFDDIRRELEIKLAYWFDREISQWLKTGKWPEYVLNIEAGTCPVLCSPALLVSYEWERSKTGASIDLTQWLDDHWRENQDKLADEYAEELEALTPDEAAARLRAYYVGRESDYRSDWTSPLDLFADSPLLNCREAIAAEIEKVKTMLPED